MPRIWPVRIHDSSTVNASDEQSRSLWMDTIVAEASPLTENVRADTIVVGSGIAGLDKSGGVRVKNVDPQALARELGVLRPDEQIIGLVR
jgi:hypothetical protein